MAFKWVGEGFSEDLVQTIDDEEGSLDRASKSVA